MKPWRPAEDLWLDISNGIGADTYSARPTCDSADLALGEMVERLRAAEVIVDVVRVMRDCHEEGKQDGYHLGVLFARLTAYEEGATR